MQKQIKFSCRLRSQPLPALRDEPATVAQWLAVITIIGYFVIAFSPM